MSCIVHYILYVSWQDSIAENKRCRSGCDENSVKALSRFRTWCLYIYEGGIQPKEWL